MLPVSRLVSLAKRFDCSVELFSERFTDLSFSSKRERISSKSFSSQQGYALRAIKNRGLGFASFERESETEQALKRALKLARLQEKADYFFAPKRRAESKKFYDRRIAGLQEEVHLSSVKGLLSSASETGAENLEASFSSSSSVQTLLNSEGLFVEQRFSHCSAFSHCAFGRGEGMESFSSAFLDFKADGAAKKAAEYAKALSSARRVSAGEYRVVFDAHALRLLFGLFLSFNFSAETHRKKLSKLKLGSAIACSGVTISDNPLLEKGENSAEFDDEGFETKEKRLVESGGLADLLSDSAASCRGFGSPGNASRHSYQASPEISFSNLVVSRGEVSDAVGECRKGLLVHSFLTSGANPVNGDYSFPLHTAFLVENGETKHAVTGAMLQGNFFRALKEMRFEKKQERVSNLLAPRAVFTARIIS